MLTDKDCANICSAIYEPAAIKWDHLWQGDIYAGISGNVLCFRGSVTLEDWLDDIDAMAVVDKFLGGVHAGFYSGLESFLTQVLPYLGENPVITGHSLGAARACIFGAMLAAKGKRPAAVITFGCPRPGFLRLYELLNELTCRWYKNRYDPVTDVPEPIIPTLPYLSPPNRIMLDVVPPMEDFSPFADHHPVLYAAGTPPTIILP